MRPSLQQAYKYMLVGYIDEAIGELRSVNTLESVVALAQIRLRKRNIEVP